MPQLAPARHARPRTDALGPLARAARAARAAVGVGCAALAAACVPPARPPGTVVFASGTDLESANGLVTVHRLSQQVQRYALFVTLARYDSLLRPAPYFARSWTWSADRRALTLALDPGLRWHDGVPTGSADVVFTLDAARDVATGYPRYGDLAALARVEATDSVTAVLRFTAPQPDFPAVLCELPLLPAHLLGGVPHGEMRRAAFNLAPVGNGPFRFVRRDAGQRWLFERNAAFPPSLGGPPRIARFVVAVVDEPTTKFAGLVSGELDVAGIAPTTAALAARDPALRVLTYPVQFVTGIVFNVARPPCRAPPTPRRRAGSSASPGPTPDRRARRARRR
jgi:peptide/nickel transport system substrate-binding protein